MGALVLACGNQAGPDLGERDGVEVVSIPSRPARADVDPLVKALDDRRLVIKGTDADLAAVVVRLMRLSLLSTPIGFVPVGRSAIPGLWGIPADPTSALRVALDGELDHFPLVRDDTGGVLVGLGVLKSVRGVAYCDDTTALRGRAQRIEVVPDPESGLAVRVVRLGLLGRRVETMRGRAFQVGCLPAIPESNGVAHPRDVSRWTWYRHTEDLRIARGLV
ncbi:hypothetical protein [Alloactinosynnema sp. L-07]|uniref:hypothetical protein n=1 Tax=Alloactinosynnema sp. L-07 TaxID=1653480 RepID=UPI00065F01A6|nr:hypothetical protein [Alloactinosynnema sp. L-07]CRK60476.1 hypothetical protein [Alloactinosynnema sp. L-07]